MKKTCQKSYRVLKTNGRLLEKKPYLLHSFSFNQTSFLSVGLSLGRFSACRPQQKIPVLPPIFPTFRMSLSQLLCLPHNLPPPFVFWLSFTSSSASSNPTSDMWQDSQAQGPGLFSTQCSSVSSCLHLCLVPSDCSDQSSAVSQVPDLQKAISGQPIEGK